MKFPEIETLLTLFQREEITEQRLIQLLDKHAARRDRSSGPSRSQTTLGLVAWSEP